MHGNKAWCRMNEPDEIRSHPVEESTNGKPSKELRLATPFYDGIVCQIMAVVAAMSDADHGHLSSLCDHMAPPNCSQPRIGTVSIDIKMDGRKSSMPHALVLESCEAGNLRQGEAGVLQVLSSGTT